MDRIQPTPPDALRLVLSRPSLSAQLLTAAADQLTGTTPEKPVTGPGWGRALALAGARVLAGYPSPVANNAAARAITALGSQDWADARTCGHWAERLRAAAGSI